MKYAAIMTTGLLVNISLFASDISSTERYSGLMDNKQRMIKQLDKQVECIKLANNDQELQTCQDQLIHVDVSAADTTDKNSKEYADEDANLIGFF